MTLIECTQFCDKGTIVKEMAQLREDFGFSSKNKCKEFFDDAQNLRNNVAHAQKALYRDSQKLIKIMLEIKRVLEATESMS